MNHSRRSFLNKGGKATAAGMLGLLAGGCKSQADDEAPESATPAAEPTEQPTAMIGACGLSCTACPLMKAGKCKGCSSGKDATPEMIEKKPCPVFQCAAMKKIAYCGTDCPKFTECAKLIGHPYDQSYMDMMKKKMGA